MNALIKLVVGVVLLSVVLVGSLVGAAKFFDFNPFGITTVDRSGPTLLERVRTMEEFKAAEASFVQDIDVEKDTKFLPGVVSGERYVAIVTGTVDATIDLSGLDESAIVVDEAAGKVVVTLPRPELDEADVDEKSLRVLTHDRGFANRVGDFFSSSLEDQKEVFVKASEKMDEAAAESDLVQRAAENTEVWFQMFLTAAGFSDISVVWQD